MPLESLAWEDGSEVKLGSLSKMMVIIFVSIYFLPYIKAESLRRTPAWMYTAVGDGAMPCCTQEVEVNSTSVSSKSGYAS